MLELEWIKCANGNAWCPFQTVKLDEVNTFGVYIIWHTGNPSRVVRLGQGNVADRIIAHRDDPKITQYESHGTMRVTWAAVAPSQVDGVERYLADQWSPLVGDAFPDVHPIAVNSPW